MSNQDKTNVYKLGGFDADLMLADIKALRERIVLAWRERAVMLTREEQVKLDEEVTATCTLLLGLTRPRGDD